jgi:glycosyltransferase involved in cell wall biosynthesis
LVVPVGNADAMAAAIVQIATSHEQREAFSQNAKADFQSRFTLPVMVEEYMRLYRDTPRARRVLK